MTVPAWVARVGFGPFLLVLAAAGAPLPPVLAVHPSGTTLPQRVLRLSVVFASPPAGDALASIALRREDGAAIEGALLDQALWSPDGRTLTLLLDPGRVKTGLIAHDRAGWALRPGERVALSVGGAVARRWTVVAGGCVAPDPAGWRITSPRAGTRDALRVGFPAPVDGMATSLIIVVEGSRRVVGAARLEADELGWTFVPTQAWPGTPLRLMVNPGLESPCGDPVGSAFEVAAGEAVAPAPVTLALPFQPQ